MLGAALFATTNAPAAAADTPTGYAGKGTLVVQTSIGGTTTLTVGGDIAFEARDPQIRLDVQSLRIPGADPTVSAVMGTQLFPAGGFTIVFDRRDGGYVVWSVAKRSYYASPTPAATQAQTKTPAATPGPSATGGLPAIFGLLGDLRNERTFTASLSLAGHGTVNGHPATGLNFAYLKTSSTGAVSDVHGTLQIADDLTVPVEVAASVKTDTIPQSSFKLDATTIAPASSPATDFSPPPGYARATALGDVLGKTLSL